jgi:hypothetical protein
MTVFEMCSISIKLFWINLRLTACILLVVYSSRIDGQVLQPRRFEIPLAPREKHFEIVSAGADGLFLERVVQTAKEDELHLVRLDTAFNALWQGFIPVEKNYVVMGKKAYGDKLYVLLRYIDYSRNDFILLLIDNLTGKYNTYHIKGFIPFAPTEFTISETAVLIGGYYNKVPVVLHYSKNTMRSKVLPGLFNDAGELTQIKTYDDGTFDVLISSLNLMRQRTIFIKSYDADGNLLRNYPLEVNDNRHLIFGRSLKSSNDVKIVAGVFGNRSAEFSRGIFIASLDDAGGQSIRYYDFGDLENFFKYMKAKREQRVKDRIERRKIKGKKIRFNYQFLVHEIVPYRDQYILLGEAFYPKYINLDRGYYNGFFSRAVVNSNSPIKNGRIFDGYYYTHAVVMGFQPNGDLVWDNSFEINDVRTFTLDQFVKLEVQGDRIALLYLFENQLRTKIIHNNEVLEGKNLDPIKTGGQDDVVKYNDSEVNKLEYWYNDYMFAYGVQEIENPLKAPHKRRVFYITKIKHAQP